jgi:hypothetical protein
LNSFVAGGTDLKENLVLPLQHDFPIVKTTGQVHQPVRANQQLTVQITLAYIQGGNGVWQGLDRRLH